MMKRIFVWVLLWLAMAGACAFSAEVSEIYLADGSVLRAEVVSLENGIYKLRSASMGEFTLEASRVSQIGRYQPDQNPVFVEPGRPLARPSGSQEDFQAKVAVAQSAIMSDPQGMQAVMEMASDPEFLKLIEDPEAVAALKSGDLATLMKKPQFRAIMDSPKMKGFAEKMKDKIPE